MQMQKLQHIHDTYNQKARRTIQERMSYLTYGGKNKINL